MASFDSVFLRVPRLLYDFLLRWAPTLVKAVRVLVLASVWLMICLGPAAIAILNRSDRMDSIAYEGWYGAEIIVNWLKKHDSIVNPAFLVWSVAAFSGSIWGAVYLHRRHKAMMADRE